MLEVFYIYSIHVKHFYIYAYNVLLIYSSLSRIHIIFCKTVSWRQEATLAHFFPHLTILFIYIFNRSNAASAVAIRCLNRKRGCYDSFH